jgi:very-short-patch-repair endonuclease
MSETKVKTICNKCGDVSSVRKSSLKVRMHPDLCRLCAQKLGGYNRQKQLTPEEKSSHGKKMRASVKITGVELRRRQQDFIDGASEEYYKEYCEKRGRIAQNFHDEMTDEEKEEHYKKVFKDRGHSIEGDKFLDELERNGIKCDREEFVTGFIVDGIVNGTKTIIEFYGDIFHCNPNNFDDPEKFCSWIGRKVKDQWKRDERRIAAFYKNGYDVIIVWEEDWNNSPSSVIDRIHEHLNGGSNG